MHAMNFLLPWLASWTCNITVGMFFCRARLCDEWFELATMPSQFCLCHALFSAKSETINKTCYVYMGAIISSDPFWLMISKRLLFYALSRYMPCLCFLWYFHVACCLLALNMASWCYFYHVSIFTKSVKLISFALLPCLFESALVWFIHSSVFMFCNSLPVNHVHAFCYHVGVL